MALPFPVMVPISSNVLLGGPFLIIFHLIQSPNWQSAITGTWHDSFVPFLVPGYAISGTVVRWAPYRNWTLCMWSHFRYRALPFPVWLFLGSHTGTGLYAGGLISDTRLCQFRYGYFLSPVPELDSMQSRQGFSCNPFVTKQAPEPEKEENEWSTQYRKWDFSFPVMVPLLEMGRPFPVLVHC
jgi:hypothetical protein